MLMQPRYPDCYLDEGRAFVLLGFSFSLRGRCGDFGNGGDSGLDSGCLYI
jgi:hypothetical protein